MKIKAVLDGASQDELDQAAAAVRTYFEKEDIDPWKAWVAVYDLEWWAMEMPFYDPEEGRPERQRVGERMPWALAWHAAQDVVRQALETTDAARAGGWAHFELEDPPPLPPESAGSRGALGSVA